MEHISKTLEIIKKQIDEKFIVDINPTIIHHSERICFFNGDYIPNIERLMQIKELVDDILENNNQEEIDFYNKRVYEQEINKGRNYGKKINF